ncbi:TetR/AcrR family transcriptional regulator [Flexivirga caeni]|uniref:TetR/AcrR family transcriptional regulator n=1 Tax=Flexivirga caeni TaxID=2294115 RepID=A0A3M9M190_9MICO|nr:TetR/AcrR family transcriptional regulator [Flexivirga caeni]RNI19007.1 TetR/AcrR family transcriptional regulator [Flexivirga caeni]
MGEVIDSRDNRQQPTDLDVHAGRRHDLAVAALHTWSEHGYSQVSVRNVARRTRFSHGMVHYYFQSKDALVAECVRLIADAHIFAADCSGAAGVTDYSGRLAGALSESFRTHRRLHRVRYDLRNQSQFEPRLRPFAAVVEDDRARWQRDVQRRYEALGWHFDPPFELLAEQVDALVERAVRADLLGSDLDNAAAELHEDLLRVLPKDEAVR